MTLIESLKAFYKDNVENVDKLNDADSILEVLRAKYGNYKGSNIEEYFKELVNNGISPGGGGGEMDMPTFTVTFGDGGSATATCDKTYSECKELCDSNYFYTSPCIVVLEGDFTGQGYSTMLYDYLGDTEKINVYFTVNDVNGAVEYSADGTLSAYIDY